MLGPSLSLGTRAALLLCAGLLAVVSGCTHTCLSGPCDNRPTTLPPAVERDPATAMIPDVPLTADPATVIDPERPPRPLSLQEALAMALENGAIGGQSLSNPGLTADDLGASGISAGNVTNSDAVRVLALQPAIGGAEMERTLSRFDAQWITTLNWNKTDQPVQGLQSLSNGDSATFATSLAKPLSTGGVAALTWSTTYNYLSTPPSGAFGVLNPSYSPKLTLNMEQPLLRGFGTDINQLNPSFPGSTFFPQVNARSGASSSEGILITRLRFDQRRIDFERDIHHLALNVEAAYWRLYGSYVDLYAAEEGLRVSNVSYAVSKKQMEVGKAPPEKTALFQGQFEQFRAQRLAALGSVLDNERTLRVLLGLPLEDGTRLVPIDTPTLTPYLPNWQAALQDCMMLRPELLLIRKELDIRQKNVILQANQLLPDLRFVSSYSLLGLGDRLDGGNTGPNGPVFNNALRSLTSDHFNNWSLGLSLNVPLGFRAEHALLREARLSLAQAFHGLKDQERQAQILLAKHYNLLVQTNRTVDMLRRAREALAEQLRIRIALVEVGKNTPDEFLASATQQFTQALSQEYQSIVNYNIALAQFEYARGTILDRDRIVIAEGPVPYCAEVRAVEHEQERTRALALRDRVPPIVDTDHLAVIPDWHVPPSLNKLIYSSPGTPLEPEGKAVTPLGVKAGDARTLPPLRVAPAIAPTATLPAATLPAATLPAATLPAVTLPAIAPSLAAPSPSTKLELHGDPIVLPAPASPAVEPGRLPSPMLAPPTPYGDAPSRLGLPE
ncbi:MAG: TolC family protein [Gemmataceae bacterium]